MNKEELIQRIRHLDPAALTSVLLFLDLLQDHPENQRPDTGPDPGGPEE